MSETAQIEGIREIFAREAGTTEKAFKERSPIFEMENLKCPVLILHGQKDDRVDVSEAKNLDKALTKLNKPHKTVIYPEVDHYLLLPQVSQEILDFLKENL